MGDQPRDQLGGGRHLPHPGSASAPQVSSSPAGGRTLRLDPVTAAAVESLVLLQAPAEHDPAPDAASHATTRLLALLAAGVDFSVPEADLTSWLANPEFTPYPALADALLRLLAGRTLRQPAFIDVIVFNYEDTPGVPSPRDVPDVDLDVLRSAVVEAFNTRNGSSMTTFESLVE